MEFDGEGKLSEDCMLILEVEQKKGDKLFTLSPVPLNEIIHFMQDTGGIAECVADKIPGCLMCSDSLE